MNWHGPLLAGASSPPPLLAHYLRELRYLREGAADFARAYPDVAPRLGLDDSDAVAAARDPDVERLLEAVAFLAARVQWQIEAGHPRFVQHLLSHVLPHHATPVPAIAVLALEPALDDPALAAGPVVPAGAGVATVEPPGDALPCRFRTGHAVRLWPLRLVHAWLRGGAGVAEAGAATRPADSVRGCLGWRLCVEAGLVASRLALDDLVLHLCGDPPHAHALHALLQEVVAVRLLECPEGAPPRVVDELPGAAVSAMGFAEDEALLPVSPGAPEGVRWLKEYAGCPERFLFVRVRGLRRGLARMSSTAFELHLMLRRCDAALEREVDAASFALHATPAVNLHVHRADRIALAHEALEFRVVPDGLHPGGREVFAVTAVRGLDASGLRVLRRYLPLHEPVARGDVADAEPAMHGYAVRRCAGTRARGGSGGDGPPTELWLSLSDAGCPPWPAAVAQLAVETLCSDHHRPLRLPPGDAAGWHLAGGAPVCRVRCLRPPSRPLAAAAEGPSGWRLLGHVTRGAWPWLAAGAAGGSGAGEDAARGLRDYLALLAPDARSALHCHAAGLLALAGTAHVHRHRVRGPAVFGPGVAAALTVDESAFAGAGPSVLGSVLHRTLAAEAPPGMAVSMSLSSSTRGLRHAWPARGGAEDDDGSGTA